MVTWLEITGLDWLVLDPFLFRLCFLHVLLHDGSYHVDLILYTLDVFNYREEQGQVLLPGFLGHIY